MESFGLFFLIVIVGSVVLEIIILVKFLNLCGQVDTMSENLEILTNNVAALGGGGDSVPVETLVVMGEGALARRAMATELAAAYAEAAKKAKDFGDASDYTKRLVAEAETKAAKYKAACASLGVDFPASLASYAAYRDALAPFQ